MQALLTLPDRPTALFVCNDLMAMGAISAATAAGLKVPDDISIIGYDNVALAEFMSPPLTTINQPKEELGRLAVTQLMSRINGDAGSGRLIKLEPNLVIRASCCAPSAA
jgi:LacI family transcriptional regulator